MPKKRELAWKTAMKEIAKSDAGYLWTTEEDEWVALSVHLSTLREEEPDVKTGGPHKFSWFSVVMDTEDSAEESQREEIPFWAKKDFVAFIAENEAAVEEDGIIDLWYQRSKGEKGNQSAFRLEA